VVLTTVIAYPTAIIAQFTEEWAGQAYIFSILFMCFWMLFAAIQVRILYPSERNRRGKVLLILTFLSFSTPLLLLTLFPSSMTLTLGHLGVDAWFYLTWYTIISHSNAYILTQKQAVEAAHAFYDLKSEKERVDCIVYDNVDEFLREIPEELIFDIDDDKLTNMWIGLQRTS
jgi:hypothetical protein